MQSTLIGLVGRSNDDGAVLPLGLAPAIKRIAAQATQHEDTKHHDQWVDIDDGNAWRHQHDHNERNVFLK